MAYSLSKVILFGAIGLILAASIILTVQFIPILEEPQIPDIPVVKAGGMLIIKVTDAPADELEELFLLIDKVLVHKKGDGDETWMEIKKIVEDPFDLLLLADTSLILAVDKIPTGDYTEIRLHVNDAYATIGEDHEIPLKVVANGWLKIKVHFTIEEAPVTSVTVDIQVNPNSIVNARILHPVVKAEVKYILIPDTPTLEQHSYLWAENADPLIPPPNSENTSISDVALTGAILRLRLSIRNIGLADWSNDVKLKVQYSFNQKDWDDVDAEGETGIWRYYDGLGTDKAIVANLFLDDSSVEETFVESAPTKKIEEIPIDGQGEWDICIESNGVIPGKTYYFRFVLEDGTPLDVYSEYPTLTTGS